MSGGVGPVSEIRASTDHEDDAMMKEKQEYKVFNKPKRNNGFSHLQQLNALAIIVVLSGSASGMISIQDFAFVVFTLFYMYLISKLVFPTFSSSAKPPVFGEKNKILGLYVFVGGMIGLFLPIAYILRQQYRMCHGRRGFSRQVFLWLNLLMLLISSQLICSQFLISCVRPKARFTSA